MKRLKKEKQWRCRLSDQGRKLWPQLADALGSAWFPYRIGYVRVLWDDAKTPKTYLAEYIEKAE